MTTPLDSKHHPLPSTTTSESRLNKTFHTPWRTRRVLIIALPMILLLFFSLNISGLPLVNWLFGDAGATHSIGTVTWYPCGIVPEVEGTECGHIMQVLHVPKDYFNYSAGTAKIALGRYKARVQPSKGTVFFNPGGPGGSGKTWIAGDEQTASMISNLVGDEYDIIGFDPRGVGNTQPKTKCFSEQHGGAYASFVRNTVLERGYSFASNMSFEEIHTLVLSQEREADALLRTQFEACRQTMGDELRYVGTSTVVRDVDFMSRIITGEDALINFYGVSYGSVLGQYLVNMLPDRVGRVVIDGIVNIVSWSSQPAYLWHRQWLSYAEETYDTFFAECSKVGPPGCSLASTQGEDSHAIKNRLEGFFDQLYYQPISSPTAKHPGILTDGRARRFLLNGLYRPVTWPFVANAFAEAMKGDGSTILDSNEPATDRDLSRTAVTCNDQASFSSPTVEEIVDERLSVYNTVSRFAFAAAALENADFGCHYWPVVPPERFHGPWNNTPKNPILVLSNTVDPITPLSSGHLTEQLLGDSARLLVLDGPGHTVLALPSLCIKTYMNTFFANGTLPPKGTICQTSTGPFPGGQ